MSSTAEKYKADYAALMKRADMLQQSLLHYAYEEEYADAIRERFKGKKKEAQAYLDSLPNFRKSYQAWYSEALSLLKQLLPDRVNDFIRLYEKPKGRKDISFESYRIEDALQGLVIRRAGEVLADSRSAVTHLNQQVAILASLENRFESSLYDIKQLVQADLLDSELDAAKELLKHKFQRAAGAIAGVVLEKHLQQVCESHNVKLGKKATIANLNDALKDAGVIGTPEWRFHQHLGDIRNLCDHNKEREPTSDQVRDLIDGVAKVTKTLF